MDIPAPAYAAIGTISAATIAGGITFLIAVLSKDQKTSEFRQAWIDALRSEIAEFISYFILLTDVIREIKQDGQAVQEVVEYLKEKDEHFRNFEMVSAKIKLRLNPTEHQKLLAALERCGADHLMDSKAIESLVVDLIRESQFVLKSEWKRVKRGEPVFIGTKVISLTTMVVAIILGFSFANGHLHVEWLP